MGVAGSLMGAWTGSGPVRGAANFGFGQYARRRVRAVAQSAPGGVQEESLRNLLAKASQTRFGRDHGFSRLRTVADFQKAVPLRTYEDLWSDYLRDQYPVFEDLTWPGRTPYVALTSGTTLGATKYIPVTKEMVASNLKASLTMLAFHYAHSPEARLFGGRMFFLGGSTNLEKIAPGVSQGDLSGIAAIRVNSLLRPYTFPPLDLALEPDWDRKLSRLAEESLHQPITLVGGVPSWLLVLFQKLLELSGKETIGEVWPSLEVVVHGGVKFDPYQSAFQKVLGKPGIRLQESYPCSEGFVAFGDPATGLLRPILDHGLFHEFVPVEELGSASPTRHWIGSAQTGVNYAIVVSTCAGLWAHVIGDTVRFEALDPPLITFTGRTKYALSAFGEHLISEEVEAAMASASEAKGCSVRDWHVGAVFTGALGYHQYVIEYLGDPPDLEAFRRALDEELSRRNADYQAHRADRVGLPLPSILAAKPGGFDAWMRSRGKLGGQHKVPRMDNTGSMTAQLVEFLEGGEWIGGRIAPGS